LKMKGFPTLKGSWPWPWIGSYCIPSCITHRPLPTVQIWLKSKKLFLWTDGHLRPTVLGRLRRVDLKWRWICFSWPYEWGSGAVCMLTCIFLIALDRPLPLSNSVWRPSCSHNRLTSNEPLHLLLPVLKA